MKCSNFSAKAGVITRRLPHESDAIMTLWIGAKEQQPSSLMSAKLQWSGCAWLRFALTLSAIVTSLCTTGLAASAAAVADDVTLKAGFAKADITPDPQMLNWTVVPPRPYGEVHDPLFVRALVLSVAGTRLAIIGW